MEKTIRKALTFLLVLVLLLTLMPAGMALEDEDYYPDEELSQEYVDALNSELLAEIDIKTVVSGTGASSIIGDTSSDDLRIRYASQILQNSNIKLAKSHTSGISDNAFAYNNIVDTANGLQASRSSYLDDDGKGTPAPGGTVYIDISLLKILLDLEEHFGTVIVSEIAGGCHSPNSKHYRGIAVDLTFVGGNVSDAKGREIYSFLVSKGYSLTDVFGGNSVKENSYHYHIALKSQTPSVTTGKIDIKCLLDGVYSDGVNGYGTFDLYINGYPDPNGQSVPAFSYNWPVGTPFEIRNITPVGNHDYLGENGSGTSSGLAYSADKTAISGTIGTEDTTIQLKFRTNNTGSEISTVGKNDFYARIHCANGLYLFEQDDHNVCAKPLQNIQAEIWHFELQSDNYYKITSASSGRSLDVKDFGTTDGTNLQTYPFSGNTAQLWALHKINGMVEISAKCTPCVIDAGAAVSNNYNNAYMLHEDGPNGNQLFTLEDTSKTSQLRIVYNSNGADSIKLNGEYISEAKLSESVKTINPTDSLPVAVS